MPQHVMLDLSAFSAHAQQQNDAGEWSYSEEQTVVGTRSELRGAGTACISKEITTQLWL